VTILCVGGRLCSVYVCTVFYHVLMGCMCVRTVRTVLSGVHSFMVPGSRVQKIQRTKDGSLLHSVMFQLRELGPSTITDHIIPF
jgi:hypothetical protein